jgi:hypothetical protein
MSIVIVVIIIIIIIIISITITIIIIIMYQVLGEGGVIVDAKEEEQEEEEWLTDDGRWFYLKNHFTTGLSFAFPPKHTVLTRGRSDGGADGGAEADDDDGDLSTPAFYLFLRCTWPRAIGGGEDDDGIAQLPVQGRRGVRFADEAPVFSDDRSAASSTFRWGGGGSWGCCTTQRLQQTTMFQFSC